MNNWLYKIWLYFLFFICLLVAIGGMVYKIYALNNFGVIISLGLTISGLAIFIWFDFKNIKNKRGANNVLALTPKNNNQWMNLLLLTAYCLLLAIAGFILFKSRTANAIVSPWQVIPNYFFIIYALATTVLGALIIRGQKFILAMISLHYFFSLSIALIIYAIGYGFDPFIHRATMDLINTTGAVYPKPWYYLGQYALIVILHKITFLPIIWLDKLLVPVLAALYLPTALNSILRKWFNDNKKINFIIIAFLAIPSSFLILTTPQNFAYLFLLLAILFGLTAKKLSDLVLTWLLAAAALVTQAVAGLPALFLAVALTVYYSSTIKIKKYLYILIFVLAITALPAAFAVVEKNNNQAGVEINLPNNAAEISPTLLTLSVPNQENIIFNFIYLYGFNYKLILFLITLAGVYLAWKHRTDCRVVFIYLGLAGALFIAFLLTSYLPFKFLIGYERGDYADRVAREAWFFLIPFILIALYGFIDKLTKKDKILKIAGGVFLVLLLTISLYLTYPRFDHYFNSRGYSVSRYDIESVQWINNDAENDYIVLADQQVSAAALQKFGFAKYYPSDIFYYPIPTGGPLYPFYLDMVYKQPSRETMFKAMDLTGVKTSYFVLNKYWWAFPKILDEAKNSADSWKKFGDGEVYVYKYAK